MGKQINYWIDYEDFLEIAQTALDCGCIIIRSSSEKMMYGQSLHIVTEEICQYYFYLPEAGKMMSQQIPFPAEQVIGYNAAGNTVIEAGFSFINEKEKEITRSRLFTTSGYYDETGEFIVRPECLTKVYHKLVRTAKKVAPYTEIVDYITSIHGNDYLQEKEWRHKEYVSPSCLALKVLKNYRLI